jgi:hypothetical protein
LEDDWHSRWPTTSWKESNVRQMQEVVLFNHIHAILKIAEKEFLLVVVTLSSVRI